MISRKSIKDINERERFNSNNKSNGGSQKLLNVQDKTSIDKKSYFRKAS